MINIHFNFRLDVPIILNKFSIFDKKNSKSYIDYEKTSENVKKIADDVSKVNRYLLKLAHAKNRFSLTLPGYAVEYLSKERREEVDELKKILSSSNTEILASTYYNSFANNYSVSEFKKQIRKELDYIKTHFSKSATTFVTHMSPKDSECYYALKEVGINQIYISGYNDFEDPKNHNDVFNLKKEDMGMIFRHHNLSVDLNDKFFDERFRKENLTPSNFISWLKKIDGNIINLSVEFDSLYNEEFREFLVELFDRIDKDSEMNTILPSEINEMMKVEIKDSVGLELGKYTLTEMQIDSQEKLFSLEKDLEIIGNEELLEDWRMLQNLYFVRDFSQNSKFNYQKNHESRYELYVSFMNIIEDMKRRIDTESRKDLSKTKEESLVGV